MRLAVALLALSACRTDPKDPGDDTAGTEPAPVDEDGDGFDVDEDCDDTDAAVNPSAEEVCNDVDDDCDDAVDEGVLQTFYADADGDTYGDAGAPTEACSAPAGTVTDDTDCDDSDVDTYPDAAERCDEVDNDCDGDIDEEVQTTWFADADDDGFGDAAAPLDSCDPPDGYTGDATDCDDADATSFPGGDEVCDDADNDCNGAVDDEAEDAVTFYADADGDGYGDAATSVTQCDIPSGYVVDDTDCDDVEAAVSPGATEVCNGIDDDCDGDADSDAVDRSTWYVDVDGDGYGSTAFSTLACDQPTGFEADATDCNDGDAAINPAATEVCDSEDNDCDGTTDEDDATDALTWYADADGDGYGDASSTTTACTEPSAYTSDDSDCDDSEATAYPGSTETEVPGDGIDQDCDGIDACTDLNCDGIPDIFIGNHYSGTDYVADQQIFYGDGADVSATADETFTSTGAWSTQAEDIDDDGYLDLLVVNYQSSSGHSVNSYIYWGTATGYSTADRTDLQTDGALLADIADYDGDGYNDIAFAQYYGDTGGFQVGSLVYYGTGRGFSTGTSTTLPTNGAHDVESADLDGDGWLDLVFCNHWDGASNDLDSYVYWGSVSGFSTSDRTDLAGHSCVELAIEDLDADGYDDLVMANHYDATTGYTADSYVYYGSSSGFSESDRDELPTIGTRGLATGDFNGDGQTDVAFGGYYTGSTYYSYGYVYYGASTGYSDANRDALWSPGVRDIAAADLDSDGYDDIVLPSYYASSHWTSSYVYYGSASGMTGTPTSLDTVGASRVGVGDLDQDGYPELVFNNYYVGYWTWIPDTYVYWGSASGYSESNRTDLDSYGSWPTPLLVGDTDW